MNRNVTLENGRFCVTDDPHQVIGNALDLITNNRNRTLIRERLAPDGDGFTLDTIGTVTRVYDRDDLPEPWNEDEALDPDNAELWVLYRDPDRHGPRVRRATVVTGDELRALVSQALKLCDENQL